ncbi:MAG: hypothetical protein GY951_18370 [Psychromonas sp.]|nr:hypothetical protein [Alteromonadales bacterium]MCP5079997.1 hypothetical protein [Psychromonas sp.]
MTDTRSSRSSEESSSACAISGKMEQSYSDNSNGSFEVCLHFIDCVEEIDTLQNGTLMGKGNISDDLSSAFVALTGDVNTANVDNYTNIDVTMSIKGDSYATTITYELNYEIASPSLIGDIKVSTNPALTIDSNNNLSGKVIIEG